ncbi:IPT/TIG domain-containing protein [Mucilaginibacter ximonensis]|uniref:IPT/TIG domain-containing protein n=1 Tax=Mucilaginibacter ximonensis TaxID=538021 RepID=A0ABW5YGZ9_9SPHI
MRTLKLNSTVPVALMAVCLLTFNAGCKKPGNYKPDYNNSYINSTPTTGGGAAKPVLGVFSPGSALPNTVIKITGSNFDPVAANNMVTVGGVAATVNAASSTFLYFTVPQGAVTGPVVVKTNGATLTSVVDFKVLTGTSGMFMSLPDYSIEHISFNGNGDLIGESTSAVYRITPAGNVSLYNQPYTFGSLWGSANYYEQGVYVTDHLAGKIFRVSTEGLVTLMGGSTQGITDGIGSKAQFNAPLGLCLDAAGNIYTTDTHRVRKISSSALVTTIAGNASVGSINGTGTAAQFGDLHGLTYNKADSSIYVTDLQFFNIRKISAGGVVTTLAGSGTKGMVDGPGATAQFVNPYNIAADDSGNIVVADGNSSTGYAIRLINKYGVVSTLLSGPILNAPDGMAFDPQGNLYVMNTGAKNIIKITFQ